MTNTNYEIIQILQIFGTLVCNIFVKLALACAFPEYPFLLLLQVQSLLVTHTMIPFQGPFQIGTLIPLEIVFVVQQKVRKIFSRVLVL